MNRKQKRNLIRICIAAALLVIVNILRHVTDIGGTPGFVIYLCAYLVIYLVIGYDILRKAGKGIINGRPFDECFLMAFATLGAFALAIIQRSGDYNEAVAVMLFYQIGELFQSIAVGRSRRNISDLMDIRPDYANIEKDGSLVQVDPDEVEIGTVIVVQPGEKVPIDGVVVEGSSSVNTAALTGESVPRVVREGDEIISGCINLTGVLRIRTTKAFGESTVSRILELVENASSRKSRSEEFISRFARYYTPAVVFSALALAIIPPLFAGNWSMWIYRALTFLVISCPCALVISIPLSFFAGIGGASREGILVKGSNFLEMLSKTKTVVFDKTGTLTRGVFEVVAVHHAAIDEKKIIELAAHVEGYSSHPISKSIQKAFGGEIDLSRVSDVEEISGHGVMGKVDGKTVAAGNMKLMDRLGIKAHDCHSVGTIIHVAYDGSYVGHIVISDVVKPDSKAAIAALKASGVQKTVMLTGDAQGIAANVAAELGIDEYHAGLLPEDKVRMVERLLEGGNKLAFVGDGINDAPVLTRADLGIAMGAMGSDAAIEAADVVLMDDNPMKIAKAISISRKCLRIVYQNIVFALAVKFACLILGALGITNMWAAIFADVGVMVIAVLNSIRALRTRNT
ncbi:MAG: cadmium-translocating P-type ATPase [Spirochaetales bacterium]|nr:cadmium-translocating P-type ATPase [Spirochaetales bacterium]